MSAMANEITGVSMFAQAFVQAKMKENIKALLYLYITAIDHMITLMHQITGFPEQDRIIPPSQIRQYLLC